jgi:aerobic carbon-monoxide dehydrogenase medium subunit
MAVERYLTPSSVEEALHLLHEMGDEAKVIGGGQSLLLLMREGFLAPRVLVGLRNVGELAGIAINGGARIRACATHTEVLSHPQIRAGWPVLAEAEEAVASVQVRNRGTLCGNLAHAFPNADPPAALLVLDAVAEVASQAGRREVPMEDLITGPLTTALAADELLTSIVLPPQPEGGRYAYLKYATRPLDLPILGVAVRLVVDGDGACRDARIGLNAAAHRPLRARAAEAMLVGTGLEDNVLAAAADAAAAESDPPADIDGSVAYKRKVIRAYVRRALQRARAR